MVHPPRDRVGHIPRSRAAPAHVTQHDGVFSRRPPRAFGGSRGGGARGVAVWVVHSEQLERHRKESRFNVEKVPFEHYLLFQQRDAYRDTEMRARGARWRVTEEIQAQV